MARALAELGCDIVTGGGPGLMQAANEGAAEAGAAARKQSIGIRVDLPFEQEVNPFVEQMFEHRTFFTRLHHFVIASDAFVVAPGGIGTVLETMMIWQLLQVRHLHDTPLILVGKMWAELRAVGAGPHAGPPPGARERRGSRDPALRRHRRRGHRGDPGVPRPVDAGAARVDESRWRLSGTDDEHGGFRT